MCYVITDRILQTNMTDEFSKECEQLCRDWRELREDYRKLREEFKQRDIRTQELIDKLKMYHRYLTVKEERDSMKVHIREKDEKIRELEGRITELEGQISELRADVMRQMGSWEQQRNFYESEQQRLTNQMARNREQLNYYHFVLENIESEMNGISMFSHFRAIWQYRFGPQDEE